jgi:hypothetical protein
VGQAARPELFFTRFPSGNGKWQVSTEGGLSPRWNQDSQTLYYIADTGPARERLVAVDVDPAAAIPFGAGRTLLMLGREDPSSVDFSPGLRGGTR